METEAKKLKNDLKSEKRKISDMIYLKKDTNMKSKYTDECLLAIWELQV